MLSLRSQYARNGVEYEEVEFEEDTKYYYVQFVALPHSGVAVQRMRFTVRKKDNSVVFRLDQ